ncbi:hypothetical protein JOL62DRAFT_420338 [Phyllosticta paracitricarpa]|uniref:Uncharacterized protein n=1 Tax=Phyllosticta paracitricarpa TaxID=2016321 RepID=A0ABR1NCI6_9PEZI
MSTLRGGDCWRGSAPRLFTHLDATVCLINEFGTVSGIAPIPRGSFLRLDAARCYMIELATLNHNKSRRGKRPMGDDTANRARLCDIHGLRPRCVVGLVLSHNDGGKRRTANSVVVREPPWTGDVGDVRWRPRLEVAKMELAENWPLDDLSVRFASLVPTVMISWGCESRSNVGLYARLPVIFVSDDGILDASCAALAYQYVI